MPGSLPSSRLTPDQPWPGADAYTEADHPYFHGRKRETEELVHLIQRETVTLLSGAAEAGKTSLVRAGLIPSLGEEWLPVVVRLDWSEGSDQQPVSRQLLNALEAAARSRGLDAPKPARDDDSLWEVFHRAGARWWSARQRMITPLIVLDCFEEAFTAGASNATVRRHRDRFLEELSQLASNRPPSRLAKQIEDGVVRDDEFDFGSVPVRILIVLKEEFTPRLLGLRARFPTLRENELRLTHFTRDKAREALVRAGGHGGLFANGAVDVLLPRLISGEDPEHPILASRLSTAAHELAKERLRRKMDQITADLIEPKPVASQAEQSPATVEAAPNASAATSTAQSHRGSGWIVVAILVFTAAAAYLWRNAQSQQEMELGAVSATPIPEATPVPGTWEYGDPIVETPPPSLTSEGKPEATPAQESAPSPTPTSPEPPPTPTAAATVQATATPNASPAPEATFDPSATSSTPATTAITPVMPATPAASTPTQKDRDDAAAAQSILERMQREDLQRSESQSRRRQAPGGTTR